jgi:putative oxidoreductase
MSNPSGGITALVGRLLISQIFILAGLTKIMNFPAMVGYVASAHLPMPTVSLACAAAIEVLGGLAILLGFQTKIAAWIEFLFLIPTTLLFHNFWALQGAARIDNIAHFQKNLAIMGGLLFLALYGAGRYSIDSARSSAT